jgi:hypothetical protein
VEDTLKTSMKKLKTTLEFRPGVAGTDHARATFDEIIRLAIDERT